MSFSQFATVVLDKAIDKPLDYGIPDELLSKTKPGVRVMVLVRGKPRKATIISLQESSNFPGALPITKVISETSALSPDLLTLADWIHRYYCCNIDKAISCMLPSSVKKDMQEKTQSFIEKNISIQKLRDYTEEIRAKHTKQAQVLDVILQHPKGILLSELLEKAAVGPSPLETLLKKEILKKRVVSLDRSLIEEEEFLKVPPKELNPEQKKTFDAISASLEAGQFQTHLVQGITGSGKTEIYLYALEKAISMQKGAILLVPEIALTSQTIERLKSRLQTRIAVLHSRLSDGERFDAWEAIKSGKVSVVIGARSAIFSPLPNLGLIIVDEEQESSYKQIEETPCYHARDIAVMRGKLTGSTVVLGSATPSIESFYNAKTGKYILHTLTQRAGVAKPPHVHIVDMNLEYDKSKGFTLFSDLLLTKIKEKRAMGEQIILFLNRRGYYTSQVCTSCSKPIKCNHCDVSLTYHKSENILSCHLCGFTLNSPLIACPSCHKQETLKYRGPGTEQLQRALHAIFPDIKTLRMDRDTTKHKGSHDLIFKEFRSGKADVLIGTQMIAKGLHFPLVTLVGILNADSALNIPDFRSNESVFQLITQVSGRSGRGEILGDVVIQTMQESHPIIQLAKEENFEAFYNEEIEERKLFGYPPFKRLAKIVFSGKDPEKVLSHAKRFRELLTMRLDPSFEIHPVVPCGYTKIKDKHRFQFLVKGIHILRLSHAIETLPLKKMPSVHTHIDIDPTSTFF